MATSYLFTHKQEQNEWRVLRLEKHLLTDIRWRDTDSRNRVVQEFASAAEAAAHVECFVALRKRAGYRVREVEQASDTIVLPPELTGRTLRKWLSNMDRSPGRFVLVVDRSVSSETLAKSVDRMQEEKPSMVTVDISSRSPRSERLSRAFIDRSLPTVRSLVVTNIMPVKDGFQHGDISTVFVAMPNLQRAMVNGDFEFRPFEHSALNELYMLGEPIRTSPVETLGKCSLPGLQKLAIMLREEMRGECHDKTCAIALSTLDAPRLEWARVRGLEDMTVFLDELSSRGVPPSLHTLWLEGEISDEDALLDVLERHADVLRALRTLSLPLLDEVSSCAVERVKEILPCYEDRSNELYIFPNTITEAW